MITKFLLTLTVIVGTLIFFKSQRAREQAAVRTIKPVMTENQRLFRKGAYLFLIFMILSAIGAFILRQDDDSTTMQVRVINSQTGQTSTYQALKKDIQARRFTTLNGRQIYVSDVDRLEVEPLPH